MQLPMSNDSGAPVFDNIDELLADRIVHHSHVHSEQTDTKSFQPSVPPPADENLNSKQTISGANNRFIFIWIAGISVLLIVLYRIFNHTTTK